MIHEIKKDTVVELDNGITNRMLRVLKCTNKKEFYENQAEPLYQVEIFEQEILTRREINAITRRENCLGTFLN